MFGASARVATPPRDARRLHAACSDSSNALFVLSELPRPTRASLGHSAGSPRSGWHRSLARSTRSCSSSSLLRWRSSIGRRWSRRGAGPTSGSCCTSTSGGRAKGSDGCTKPRGSACEPVRLVIDCVASDTDAMSRTGTTAGRPPPRLATWSSGREGGAGCTTSPRHGCC